MTNPVITNAGNGSGTSSGATQTITNVNAAVGDWLVVMVAADNNGTNGAASLSTSMSDSASNTYLNRGGLINQDPGAAAAGATFSMWTCKVTAALVLGTITANFSPNTTSKGMIAYRVQPAAGEDMQFIAVGAGGTGSGTTQTGASAVSVTNGDIIFCGSAVEANATVTGDSDSTNGNWSTLYQGIANTGTTGTSMTCTAQHKTVNATGNQTWTTTTAGAQDWAANYLILRPVAATYWDAVNKTADITLSNGDLTATHTSGTNYGNVRSVHSFNYGKRYIRFTPVTIGTFNGAACAGLGNTSYGWTSVSPSNYLGFDSNGIGFYDNGLWLNGVNVLPWSSGIATGQVVEFAVDYDAKLLWVRVNGGDWNGSPTANPATGVGGVDISAITGSYVAGIGLSNTNDQVTIDSGGTPPTGFYPIPVVGYRRPAPVNRSFAVTRASAY